MSGERIVGRAHFIAVNSDDGYADERSVELLRILADGNLVVTEVEIPQDHVVHRAVSLWTVRDGEMVGAREYWTTPGQDPAPRWRAGYVEPLAAD
ncbi:nuclear transport factor 2 family protein [Streptomyces sp. NPDC097617]|uniref:nuclear transport factor 2 family protein n=1 Tax=Streptomyces sp. NPDC097617 TaxID=3366091 RepID=UPI003830D687